MHHCLKCDTLAVNEDGAFWNDDAGEITEMLTEAVGGSSGAPHMRQRWSLGSITLTSARTANWSSVNEPLLIFQSLQAARPDKAIGIIGALL